MSFKERLENIDQRTQAIFITLLIIIAFGILPSIYFDCWDWFSKSGSLIVCYGVILAWVHYWHDVALEKSASETIESIEKNIEHENFDRHASFINEYRVLFKANRKFIELIIICLGTLIWGYGDLFGCNLQSS
jgi:hypothetical protein